MLNVYFLFPKCSKFKNNKLILTGNKIQRDNQNYSYFYTQWKTIHSRRNKKKRQINKEIGDEFKVL